MFKIIKKQTRPSIDIPFFYEVNPHNIEVGKYLKESYIDTSKMLGTVKQMSDDKLTVIITISYRSYEDYKDFITDKFCEKYLFVPNTLYDIDNQITSDMKYFWE